MLSAWTQHLRNDPKAKEEFEQYVKGSKPLLNRALEIIEEDEKEITSSEISLKSYEVPNWDYKQADLNGYRRCLKKYKNLFTLDRKE